MSLRHAVARSIHADVDKLGTDGMPLFGVRVPRGATTRRASAHRASRAIARP